MAINNTFSLRGALLGEDKDNLTGSKNKFALGENNETTLIDGDTFHTVVDGKKQSVRISGVDTAETDKIFTDKNTGFTDYHRGDYTGNIDHSLAYEAAKSGGYETPVISNQNAKGDRLAGDLVNKDGLLFSDHLLRSGIARGHPGYDKFGNPYASQAQRGASIVGELDRGQRAAEGRSTETDFLVQKRNSLEGQFRAAAGLPFLAPVARNELEYSQGLGADGKQKHYAQGVVKNRSSDRNLDNTQRGWGFKQRWLSGWHNIKEDGADGLILAGDVLDSDYLRNWGEEDLIQLKKEAHQAPQLTGSRLFNDQGEWDVKGVGDFINRTAKLGTESAPYIATILASTYAGTKIGAGVGTAVAPGIGTAGGAIVGGITGFVASAAPVAFLYAGSAYGEQEVKDPSLAILSGISQASVDRLALPVKLFKGINLFEKTGAKKAVDYLMKNRKLSKAEANKLLGSTTAQQASAFFKYSAKAAVGFSGGVIKEASTEAAQEALAIWGEGKELDWADPETRERLITGAVAGGALGGPLNVAFEQGAKIKPAYANWNNQWLTSGIDQESLAQVVKTEDEGNYGHLRETSQLVNDIKAEPVSGPNNLGDTANTAEQSLWGKVKAIPGKYFQEGLIHGVKPLEQKSAIVRDLGSTIGTNNFRPGTNLQTHGDYVFSTVAGKELFDAKTFKASTGETAASLNKLYDNFAQTEADVELIAQGKQPKGTYTPGQFQFLKSAADAQRDLKLEASKGGIGDVRHVLTPTIDQRSLNTNKHAVAADVAKDLRLKKSDVDKVFTRIIDPAQSNVATKFSADGEQVALSPEMKEEHRLTREVLSYLGSDPKFKHVLNNNPFANIHANTRVMGNIITDNMFVGKNGEVIAKQLDKAVQQREITQAEAGIAAAQIKRALELRDAPNKLTQKQLRIAHDFASMGTTVSRLGLATVSSMAELAYNLNHNNDNGKSAYNSIISSIKEPVKEMRGLMSDIENRSAKNIPPEYQRGLLQHLGFLDESHKASRRQDAQTLSPFLQKFQDTYFQAIGLESWTNWNRRMRAAMANDAIKDYALSYGANVDANQGKGNKEAEMNRERLLELGVNPDVVLSYLRLVEGRTEAELVQELGQDLFTELQSEFQNNMRLGSIAFVNQGMVNPTVLNRPLWYSDPRFILFSKFHGFISAFTARQLPRLLKKVNPWANVAPQERLQAIKTIAGMIALGYLAWNIKSFLKGEDEDDLAYLDDYDKARSQLAQSGLFGSAERPINFVLPIFGGEPLTGKGYGEHSTDRQKDDQNVIQDAWGWLNRRKDDIVSESPVLGYTSDVFDVAKNIFDDEKFNTKKGLSVLPGGNVIKQAGDEEGVIDISLQKLNNLLKGG